MSAKLPRRGTVERRDHPLARELARLLNYHRRYKRLTPEQLAIQSGIDEIDIRRFERGTHAPDVIELIRLAAVFGVPAWKIAHRLDVFAARREESA